MAALLLVSQRETTKSISGNTTACLVALPLPEQIFRVLAFWALGLNYYQAPEFDEGVHGNVTLAWSKRGKGIAVPSPGSLFHRSRRRVLLSISDGVATVW